MVNAEKHAYQLTQGSSPARSRGIHTVVEVVSPGNREAMEKVHANQVICIQEFDEELLVQSVLNPGLKPLLEEILTTDEFNEAIEVPVRGKESPAFAGLTFDDALMKGRKIGVLLLAIKWGGASGLVEDHTGVSPDADPLTDLRKVIASPFNRAERKYQIQRGDSLIFLAESEKPLAKIFGNPSEWLGALVG